MKFFILATIVLYLSGCHSLSSLDEVFSDTSRQVLYRLQNANIENKPSTTQLLVEPYSSKELRPTRLKGLLKKLNIKLSSSDFNTLRQLVITQQKHLNKNGFVKRSLARGSRYIPYIKHELTQAGVPSEFAYLALVESGFKTSALSNKGAKGVWQLMPITAGELGISASQRSDVAKSTHAAIKYLQHRYLVFGDMPLLVAASYNAGEARVLSRLRRLENPSNRSFVAIHQSLPKETREYVPR